MELLAHSMSASERTALLVAEQSGGPFLVHRDAYGDLRIVPLGATERVRIGRTAGNEVVLEGDAEVSRSHAPARRRGRGLGGPATLA